MVAIRFSLTDRALARCAAPEPSCEFCIFHHRGKASLTSGAGIFIMAERWSALVPIKRNRGIITVIYWVAYQRGSFSLKERYQCPDRARSRCSDLITKARFIRLVPAAEGEAPPLNQCFELPAIG
jgi:hypothetical protein